MSGAFRGEEAQPANRLANRAPLEAAGARAAPLTPNVKGHVNGPQFTAGFSLFTTLISHYTLNVEGLVKVHNAKENVQGTIDHNYSLQKNTWIMRYLKT